MPTELGLWRVDGEPRRLSPSGVPLESRLEDMIERDPTILGEPLMLVGRQVQTDFGKFIDLLAVDGDGRLHVLELKRDKTPREVVAQALDYGSWIQELTHERILEIFGGYRSGVRFEQAFEDRFGVSPPEELNASHVLTVVASDSDPATERIASYLVSYGVPINVALFRYFEDDARSYLARTWLVTESETAETPSSRRQRAKEPWNGLDWYVTFGEESGIRSWDDAMRYGFVSAGGSEWFSRRLRALPEGGRISVYIPRSGYVGVGVVLGEARPVDETVLTVNGEARKMRELQLHAEYRHAPGPDNEEWVVPVRWLVTRPRADGFQEKGLFANQAPACKLRNRFTHDRLAEHFNLDALNEA
ncbi:endonuclease NucS domain-containing protein [Micromonospora zhanjiangensis]|uniref:Endonuclease NucS domain-containing protein n=1 Tax=Micromonospora zhanjiangensis TaxID=1522057 RepID=A0ABV8KML0_9ACTN